MGVVSSTSCADSIASLSKYAGREDDAEMSADDWYEKHGSTALGKLSPQERAEIKPALDKFWHIHENSGGKHFLEYRLDTQPIYEELKKIKARKDAGMFSEGNLKHESRPIVSARHMMEVPLSLLTYFYLKTGINIITAGQDEHRDLIKFAKSLNGTDSDLKDLLNGCIVNEV